MHIITKATITVFALLLAVHGVDSYAQVRRDSMQMKQEFLNAVKAGDETKVRELLKTDAELAQAKDEKGVSAVLQAVYYGREKIAELLIASGIKLDIFEASATGTTARVRELLKKKPDLVNRFSPDGFTPLGLASFFGHLETVRLLLDKGGKIDIPSNNLLRAVPLRSASVAGHLEVAKLLINRGANVNAVGEGGETPLHEVAGAGRIEFATLLLDHGANINARGENGKTPLTIAIENKKNEMAEFLRSRGAVE
jgi:ankyrin repeat protein